MIFHPRAYLQWRSPREVFSAGSGPQLWKEGIATSPQGLPPDDVSTRGEAQGSTHEDVLVACHQGWRQLHGRTLGEGLTNKKAWCHRRWFLSLRKQASIRRQGFLSIGEISTRGASRPRSRLEFATHLLHWSAAPGCGRVAVDPEKSGMRLVNVWVAINAYT